MKNYLRRFLYKFLTFFADREKLIFLLADDREKALLEFKTSGYLHDIGWTNTISTKNVADKDNKPLPWVTYPYIAFIANRLNTSMKVFEFGSGGSTLYYAARVARIDSVEHDQKWFEQTRSRMPANVGLNYCELSVDDNDYSNFASKSGEKYDLIIIDGRDRVNCCINSFSALSEAGVLVLDDTERDEYLPAAQFLTQNGFRRIDFWGLAPCITYLKCTTIFYRGDNCLNI